MASSLTGTSGTIATTKVTVQQMIEHAYRDAGKFAEEMTPEYVNALRQALYYILIQTTNRGVNLWLLDYVVMGAETNQRAYTLPTGTSDVREANYRYWIRPEPTGDSSGVNLFTREGDLREQTPYTLAAGTSVVASYSSPGPFIGAGFNSAAATDVLILEYSYDGTTWTTWSTMSKNFPGNPWSYIQIDGSPVASFWRFRNAGTTAISLNACQLINVQQDIPLARLNRDDYYNLPNKDFLGVRSLQYWFDRQLTPVMNMWPVPQDDFQVFQLVTETQMYDVGTLTNQLAIPDRWIPAIQAQLSHAAALQLPGVDLQRMQYLDGRAMKLTTEAEDEDRDKSPFYLRPNISYYTR